MRTLIVFLGLVLVSSVLLSNNSFAIDYVDNTGYTPSWAKGVGYHSVLLKCNELIGDYSRDGNWCFEWVAYVLDQGIENFPQSASGIQKPLSASQFELEKGPLYDGQLKQFFPDSFTLGDNWLVGKPFTSDKKEELKNVGAIDVASQIIVIPDDFDSSKQFQISFIIMQFESAAKLAPYFEKSINEINKLDLPTVGEYFELQDKGIHSSGIQLEKSKEFFVADCIGTLTNFEENDERAMLVCKKDNYFVMTGAAWNKGWIENKYLLYSMEPESAVNDYSQIIFNKMDNLLHSNPNVLFPDDSRYIAFQYSRETITDNNILNYFQKSIDEGKIKFPTDDIVIDRNSQRLSYLSDLPKIAIELWAEGLNTDEEFADNLQWMVEKGYLTVPGLDSSSITVSPEEKPEFFDMPDVSEPEPKSVQIAQDDFPRNGGIEEEETPAWAYGLAAFIIFGIPIIIIGLIIWKIKQRRRKRKIDLSKSFNR